MFAYEFPYIPSIILITLESGSASWLHITVHLGSSKVYTYLGQSFWFNWFGMQFEHWDLEKLPK